MWNIDQILYRPKSQDKALICNYKVVDDRLMLFDSKANCVGIIGNALDIFENINDSKVNKVTRFNLVEFKMTVLRTKKKVFVRHFDISKGLAYRFCLKYQ